MKHHASVQRTLFFLVLLVVTACGGSPAASPAATSGGKQPYAGTTLRLLGANHPWIDAIKPLLEDYKKQSGVTVNIESFGEDQLTQKLTTEFTSGSSDIDVFMQRPLQEAKLYVQNGWYADLNVLVKDTSKTPADYNFADFRPGAVGTEMVNGKLTGIPIVTESEVLYYRKDLLAAAGIAVPKTLDELQAAAAKLTDPGKEMFGFLARGQRSPAVTQFSSFLYSNGGDWFNQDTNKATLDTPEAIAAFKQYGTLLNKYGPPGVLNMSWQQAVAVFGQGKAAMYTDANSIFQNLLDPAKSSVADKTAIAAFPAGPKGAQMYSVTSWGLSMAASSKKQGAAWDFIKWVTSTATTTKIQGTGAVPSARESVWQSAEGKGKFPADWVEADKQSAKGKSYDRPLVVQVGKARDIIGTVITAAIQGQDVDAAAKQAQQEFQSLLDAEKKK
ncbi:MAG: sugar ABC transporter substrate-binding protein [Herpetosiphon sp.]